MTEHKQKLIMIWACILAAMMVVPTGMTLISGDVNYINNPEPAAVNEPQLDTITIQPNATVGKDNSIWHGTDTNYGISSVMWIGDWSGDELRSLVQFDIANGNRKLQSATLSLYIVQVWNSPFNCSVHALNSTWNEGTGGVTEASNWTSRTPANQWNNPGSDYRNTSNAYMWQTPENTWMNFNVTDIVDNWMDNTWPNNGFMLKANNFGTNDMISFASSDNADPTLAPKLTITYGAEIVDPVPAQTFNEDDPARNIDLSGRGNGSIVHQSGSQNDTNNFPFGGNTGNIFHYQALYTSDMVGAEGIIRNIAFNRTNTPVRSGNFSNFHIFMAHTTIDSLTTTFANNYQGSLIEVFNEANVYINSSDGDSRVDFLLNDNFTYDSQYNLLVDIQWEGDGGTDIQIGTTGTPYNGKNARMWNWGDNTAPTGTTGTGDLPVIRFTTDLKKNSIIDSGTTGTFWLFDPTPATEEHCQFLYNHTMVNHTGIIDKIYFQSAETLPTTVQMDNLVIRMAHSTNDTLGTVFDAHNNDSWVTVLNVASLTLDSGYGPNWLEIDIDNLFQYNGVDNLLIDLSWVGGTSTVGDLDVGMLLGAAYNGLLRSTDISSATGTPWDRLYNMEFAFLENDNLTWSASSSNSNVFTASISGGRNLIITPVADANGVGVAYLTLTNSDGESVTQDIPITINAVNDAPTIAAIPDVTCVEDIPFILNLTHSYDDIDDDIANLTLDTDSQYVVPDNNLLRFTYPEGWIEDNVTVTIKDDDGATNSTVVHVTITPVNDAPELTGFVNTFNCDATVSKAYTVHPSDEETVIGQLSIYTNSQYATVNGQAITFLYPKSIGSESVSIYLVDESVYGTRNNITYNLAVTINDHPEVTAHSPNGTDIAVTTTVEMTFDMAMNHTTAENAFSMILGTAEVNGTFSWNSADTIMTFTPSHVLTNGLYDVSVGASAESQTGFRMLNGYNWNFTAALGTYDGDGDGMPDQYEIDNGLDPETNDADLDYDNDGMPNIYEYDNGLNPAVNDADLDSDGDGVSNLDEYDAGTSASDPEDTPSSIPWLMMILIIVVVAVLILVAMLMMKKKGNAPEPAAPDQEFEGQDFQEPQYQEPESDAVPPPPQAEEVIQSPEELPPPPPEY